MEWKPFTLSTPGPALHGKYVLLRIRDAIEDYPRLVTYDNNTHSFHCHSHCQLTLRQFNRITHYCIINMKEPFNAGHEAHSTPPQNTMDADTRRHQRHSRD